MTILSFDHEMLSCTVVARGSTCMVEVYTNYPNRYRLTFTYFPQAYRRGEFPKEELVATRIVPMPLNECSQCGKFNLPDVKCECKPSSAMQIKGNIINLCIPVLKLVFSGEWIVEKITKRIGENAVIFSRGNCKIEKTNASMKLKVGTRVILYGWITGEAGKVLVLARYVSTAAGPRLNFICTCASHT